ncbi:unnamed protein product [Peronospora belbahrii]|uniref:Ataxin-10 domain-containing protein n=1 Tax=Peronospora belbahrii TaxID=622444 RepID=A0ABN8D2S8_9STRA|nr:unnamed protein product [Peronospora belbahrii]
MDFAALAAECRDVAFRKTLSKSILWMEAAETINTYMRQIQDSIKLVGFDQNVENDMQDTDMSEDDHGLGYTFRVDREKTTVKSVCDNVSPIKAKVIDAEQVSSQVDALTAVCRFLRNACVASCDNQDACLDAGLIKIAYDIVLSCCFWMDVEDEAVKDRVVLLAHVTLQFFVNSVTGNNKNQATVWKLFFPDVFQKVLVECHQHRNVVAFTVALILNCVNSNSTVTFEVEEVATRRAELVCARTLVITILHRCIVRPQKLDALLPNGLQIDGQDPAFEWICVLFGVLFRAGHTGDLYNAIGAHMLSKLWSCVTPEQLILLRMFTMLAISVAEPTSTAATQEVHGKYVQLLSEGAFEFVKSTWISIVTTSDDDRPDEADGVRKRMWIELENEAKLMLLDGLGELTVGHTRLNAERTRELLLSLAQELHRAWELGRRNPASHRAPGSTLQLQTSGEPVGYRSRLIRVIGNLCFRHTGHQDLMRDNGYLPLLLSHCNIDETNPFIREWSLVALRNLCEGNEANQSYINNLRPQRMDAASYTALDKAKACAHFEEDGAVKLTKQEK